MLRCMLELSQATVNGQLQSPGLTERRVRRGGRAGLVGHGGELGYAGSSAAVRASMSKQEPVISLLVAC
jgi:hypothetical protein